MSGCARGRASRERSRKNSSCTRPSKRATRRRRKIDDRGREGFWPPLPPNRTGGFPAYGLYGAFFVKGASRHFGRPLHSILLFDPRREHSSVPTAYFHRRRAQRRSRTALLQRRRRLVLDGREHGGGLPAIGWLAARGSGGSLPLAAINRANHACIRLNPYGVPTMKQSYASAGKAPRLRVHPLSGIAAIAECGSPPPRIVIGLYGAFIVKGASRHF